jgi:Cu(I)/Ag(I) efflux system protein CusF
MKASRIIVPLAIFTFATVLSVGVLAQTATEKSVPTATTGTKSADAMTYGEVRKIDKEAGKLTLKHGRIENLNMPGMTMVFGVKNKSMLDDLQVGDKVKFSAASEEGKLIVTDIKVDK